MHSCSVSPSNSKLCTPGCDDTVAQVLKPEVRDRIVAAGRDAFFERGYEAASMADIARRAGVATANIYRYVPDKAALFEAVLPDELIAEHDRLLDARIVELVEPVGADARASDLLDFWVANRQAIATLLDHDGRTSRSWYRDAFVDRLVDHVVRTLGVPLTAVHRQVVLMVFDNTRRAIAAMLRDAGDDADLRARIVGFWSYQVPGLEGLTSWIRSTPAG
jgi:AcrR family transcriptional regulator